tara:strand:+ start:323 stop:505 length:183 start_codon:yes stop_codon:yes gene_type:complete
MVGRRATSLPSIQPSIPTVSKHRFYFAISTVQIANNHVDVFREHELKLGRPSITYIDASV